MFKHLVFFKFKDAGDAPEAKRRLESMRGSVPTLIGIEVGIDALGGPRAWHMALETRFDDMEGYEAYRVDPLHGEVLTWLKTVVEVSATVDYSYE
jgi:hypothetical protein